MDARSVMEQRLQAMVCCFSMVQRVLARQPVWTVAPTVSTASAGKVSVSTGNTNSNSNNINSNSNSISSSNSSLESGSDGLLPIRTVPASEAAERVWRYLSAVPALMEVSEGRSTAQHSIA